PILFLSLSLHDALPICFGVTIAIGLLYLLSTRIFSEKTPPQWILWGNLVGFTLAMAFVFFLAHAAIFEIHALCIFCMIIWFSVKDRKSTRLNSSHVSIS